MWRTVVLLSVISLYILNIFELCLSWRWSEWPARVNVKLCLTVPAQFLSGCSYGQSCIRLYLSWRTLCLSSSLWRTTWQCMGPSCMWTFTSACPSTLRPSWQQTRWWVDLTPVTLSPFLSLSFTLVTNCLYNSYFFTLVTHPHVTHHLGHWLLCAYDLIHSC